MHEGRVDREMLMRANQGKRPLKSVQYAGLNVKSFES